MQKTIALFSLVILFVAKGITQIMPLTLEPDGGNKKASISEQIGVVKIEIKYNRPGVKGREGQIWGTTVAHYGFKDLGHGTSYAAPWRAGANENTIISFSHSVKIEGKDLPAGKYGFFIALGENESTLIFSKNSSSWGSFYYEPEADALRVTIPNQKLNESEEWLKYEFANQTDSTAQVQLSWEKRRMAFTVAADIKKYQIEAFVNDLKTTREPDDFFTAANYCLENNIALDQALAWIDRGIYFRVMGRKTFLTLNTRAEILIKLNRKEEAKKTLAEALEYATDMREVHYYARRFLTLGLADEAFNYYKINHDRFPTEMTTHIGMARAYSSKGDYKKALVYLKSAHPLATDDVNKSNILVMIKKLEEGKDINK